MLSPSWTDEQRLESTSIILRRLVDAIEAERERGKPRSHSMGVNMMIREAKKVLEGDFKVDEQA